MSHPGCLGEKCTYQIHVEGTDVALKYNCRDCNDTMTDENPYGTERGTLLTFDAEERKWMCPNKDCPGYDI